MKHSSQVTNCQRQLDTANGTPTWCALHTVINTNCHLHSDTVSITTTQYCNYCSELHFSTPERYLIRSPQVCSRLLQSSGDPKVTFAGRVVQGSPTPQVSTVCCCSRGQQGRDTGLAPNA